MCQEFNITRYPQHPEKCPCTALTFYLWKTAPLQCTKQLFIITQNKYTSAHSDTLARWICTTMFDAGIDVTKFHPHSTRSTSASAAYSKFILIDEIMHLARWKSADSFFKYYYKHQTHGTTYQISHAPETKGTKENCQQYFFQVCQNKENPGCQAFTKLPNM